MTYIFFFLRQIDMFRMFMRQVLPSVEDLLWVSPRWLHVPPKIAPWQRVLSPAIVSTTISNNLKLYKKGWGGWIPPSLSDAADSYRNLGCVSECQFRLYVGYLFYRIRESRCSTTLYKERMASFYVARKRSRLQNTTTTSELVERNPWFLQGLIRF